MQVEVGVGDLRSIAVGVIDLYLPCVPKTQAQAVVAWRPRKLGTKEAIGMQFLHGNGIAARENGGRFRVRQKSAHLPQRLRGTLSAARVWTQNTKGITMVSAHYCFDFFGSHESLKVKYGRFASRAA